MQDIILIGAAAGLGGVIFGILMGAWYADKKLQRQYKEVRGEIARLRLVAEEKLSGDDPDLNDLLNNLHSAVNGAYKAIEAMENQAALTKRKSEGGREVIASSRHIIRMIDDLAGVEHEAVVAAPKKAAPKLTTDAKRLAGAAARDKHPPVKRS